jgi:hypothetical protein
VEYLSRIPLESLDVFPIIFIHIIVLYGELCLVGHTAVWTIERHLHDIFTFKVEE